MPKMFRNVPRQWIPLLFISFISIVLLLINNSREVSHKDKIKEEISEFKPPVSESQVPKFEYQDQEELVFNPNLNSGLKQNDPMLLEYVLKHHLFPPVPVPYDLVDPKGDPAAEEKQHLTVMALLKNKTNGIFIEAGANDGEYLSTTLVLERDFGWTGLLVEPDSSVFQELRKKGRKSWTSDACLSTKSVPTKVKFVHNKKYSVLSKISHSEVENDNAMDRFWGDSEKEESTVKCFPLFSLIAALNMTVIDYFSLDIEGAELPVLETFPFESVLVRTWSIEYNHVRMVPGADEKLKELMKNKGYVFVTEINQGYAADYIYVHNSVDRG